MKSPFTTAVQRKSGAGCCTRGFRRAELQEKGRDEARGAKRRDAARRGRGLTRRRGRREAIMREKIRVRCGKPRGCLQNTQNRPRDSEVKWRSGSKPALQAGQRLGGRLLLCVQAKGSSRFVLKSAVKQKLQIHKHVLQIGE